ncbi:MAG TPA: hypothetical protein VHB77_02215 [Planctomycetaceae bacterium]|nr:hypothetical protein [Planctomycetaceae bacterium]
MANPQSGKEGIQADWVFTMAQAPAAVVAGPSGLGRLIHEQPTNHGIAIVYLICGALGTGLGLACGLGLPHDVPILIVSGVVGAGGLFYLIAGVLRLWKFRGFKVALYEHGILEHKAGRDEIVQFRDADEVTFGSTRLFVNGTYAGTIERLTVKTVGPRGKTLSFQRKRQEQTGFATGYNERSDVEDVAHRISADVANRMHERLRRGESVSWTPRMRLTPRGIDIVPPRWWEDLAALFQRRPVSATWEQIERTNFEQGFFELWIRGTKRSAIKLPVQSPNFHAGWLIAATVLQAQSEQRKVEAENRRPALPEPPLPAESSQALRYAANLEDHLAMNQYYLCTNPQGRNEALIRVWLFPGVLMAIFGVTVCARYFKGMTTPDRLGIELAITLGGGLTLAALLALAVRLMDRARTRSELNVAHMLAQQGKATDPFLPKEVTLGPGGYALKNMHGYLQRRWSEVSRADWFRGYIFVFLAGDTVKREQMGLVIPPRAFENENQAREIHSRMQEWIARAHPG